MTAYRPTATVRLTVGDPTGILSLADAKAHCKVDSSDEDTLITGYIAWAVSLVEKECNVSLLTQEWEIYFSGFPVVVPRPPVVSLDSLSYRNSSGGYTAASTSGYILARENYDTVIEEVTTSPFTTATGARSYKDFWKATVTCGTSDATEIQSGIVGAITMMVRYIHDRKDERAAEAAAKRFLRPFRHVNA